MMMVRSSEHTTLQHTTLTSWGTSRGLCAHYGCRPAISRPMAPPNCPTACWRWGVQLGQGGGGAPPAGEAKEPARLHFAKGSSRCAKTGIVSTRFAENRKNRNRLAFRPELARTEVQQYPARIHEAARVTRIPPPWRPQSLCCRCV